MDSEEIIKKHIPLLKIILMNIYFARFANIYPDPLSKDDYVKIINELLGPIRIIFEKISIDFNSIYSNMTKD